MIEMNLVCFLCFFSNYQVGYGVKNIPTQSGIFDIEVPCWRPTGSIWDKISGICLQTIFIF